ncbi:MAG: hypothetical protein WCT20_05165 [Candidatus Babeliales bacterium]|jgi:hypothetical protein
MKKQMTSILSILGVFTLAQAGGDQCATTAAAKELNSIDQTVATSCNKQTDNEQQECCCKHRQKHSRHARHSFFGDPFFDFDTDVFADTLQAIERAQANMNKIMQEQSANKVDREISIEVKDEDPAILKVIIKFSKPSEFNEKDISVTIASNELDDTKTLKVTAKKTAEADKNNEKTDKQKTIRHSASSYASYSQSYTNGRVNKRASAYNYSDGVFNWSMVLPADVITDGDYTMSFKDGELLITLNRKNDTQQVRALEFKKEAIK